MSFEPIAGKYRIAERIAAGGMGEVYRATMVGIGDFEKTVALKLVRSDLADEGAFSELFVQEARVAMRLSHANIVQSFDVGRIDERWFLAMEYIEGFDLSYLLHACRVPMPYRHVIYLAVEALRGLDYAHRRRSEAGEPLGIVHQDVSPGNLLISVEGEVKVADFGIASSTLRDRERGAIKGKIPYMAPEQLQGARVDPRADLYALGAVLYEALSGQRTVPDERASIDRVRTGEFPPLDAVAPDVPTELAAVVKRALALDPDDRFPTAAAMRQALEQIAVRDGILLSAADLAAFALAATDDVEGDRESVPAGPVAVPNPTRGATDAFDALLGAELAQVHTKEPFSVLTATVARPVTQPQGEEADRPVSPDPESPPAAAGVRPERTPARRSSRGAWPVGAWLMGVLALAGVFAAAWFFQDAEPEPVPSLEAVDRDSLAGFPVSVAEAATPERSRVADPPTQNQPPNQTEETTLPSVPDQAHEETELVSIAEEARPTEARGARASHRGRRATPRPGRYPAGETASNESPSNGTASNGTASNGTASNGIQRPMGEPGTLSFNTDPWSYVYLDGRNLGATPILGHRVPAGRHQVRFENPSEGLTRRVAVEVAPGQHRRVTLDLAAP
ncbi:MAG: protein kinase [Myxococcota bacterium]